MIENLKVFCIGYIVTLWVIIFSVNSKSIQKWKQKLIAWNNISSAEISKFVNYVYSSFFSYFFFNVQR